MLPEAHEIYFEVDDLKEVIPLLQQGIHPDKISIKKRSIYNRPLQIAIEVGDIELVKELINHGATLNTKYYHPLYICCFKAAKAAKIDKRAAFYEIAKNLIYNGSHPNFCGVSEYSPFIAACELGLYEFMQLFIKNGAKLDGEESAVACGLAAYRGHWNIVELLLESGADINQCDQMAFETFFRYYISTPYRTKKQYKEQYKESFLKLLLLGAKPTLKPTLNAMDEIKKLGLEVLSL